MNDPYWWCDPPKPKLGMAKPRKRKRTKKAKAEAFKVRQRELFAKELATVKTMTGADYLPDPSRAHECPWDE